MEEGNEKIESNGYGLFVKEEKSLDFGVYVMGRMLI